MINEFSSNLILKYILIILIGIYFLIDFNQKKISENFSVSYEDLRRLYEKSRRTFGNNHQVTRNWQRKIATYGRPRRIGILKLKNQKGHHNKILTIYAENNPRDVNSPKKYYYTRHNSEIYENLLHSGKNIRYISTNDEFTITEGCLLLLQSHKRF